jgi:FG-GAP repeat
LPDAQGRSDWFILPSQPNLSNSYQTTNGGFRVTFGQAGEIAAVGDYNNDGRPDLALFNTSNGVWRIRSGTNGADLASVTFGGSGSKVVPVLSPLFFRLRATGNLPSGLSTTSDARDVIAMGASSLDAGMSGMAVFAMNQGTATPTSGSLATTRKPTDRWADLFDQAIEELGG